MSDIRVEKLFWGECGWNFVQDLIYGEDDKATLITAKNTTFGVNIRTYSNEKNVMWYFMYI
jgi:hypothetical protein